MEGESHVVPGHFQGSREARGPRDQDREYWNQHVEDGEVLPSHTNHHPPVLRSTE
jgi:hypothetical protein